MIYSPKENINENNHLNEKSNCKLSELKNQQNEIISLTKELKSHYFLGKYFVDPDKNFMNLLDKIIVRIFLTVYINIEIF